VALSEGDLTEEGVFSDDSLSESGYIMFIVLILLHTSPSHSPGVATATVVAVKHLSESPLVQYVHSIFIAVQRRFM